MKYRHGGELVVHQYDHDHRACVLLNTHPRGAIVSIPYIPTLVTCFFCIARKSRWS